MKKFLLFLILALLLGLLLAGVLLGLFLTTQADRFVPVLKSKLESLLESSVEFQDFKVTWSGGVGIETTELRIRAKINEPQSLEAKKLRASLSLLPLLHKNIQLGAIELIQPRVHLTRLPEGGVKIGGIGSTGSPANPGETGKAAAPFALLIEHLKIKEGTFYYHDEVSSMPFHLELNQLDLHLQNFSLTHPMRFQGSAGIFSVEPNVRFQGEWALPGPSKTQRLRNLRLEVSLEKLDLGQIKNTFGSAIPSLTHLEGDLTAAVEEMTLGPAGLEMLKGQVNLDRASVGLPALTTPLHDLSGTLLIDQETIQVSPLKGRWGTGGLEADGLLRNWLKGSPSVEFDFSARNLELQELAPSQSTERHFEGTLSLEFKGRGQAESLRELPAVLQGEGIFAVENPVAVGINLMREVFDKISVIPGVVQTLEQRLPVDYKEKFLHPNTYFASIQQPFTLQNKVLFMNPLEIAADTFLLQGTAAIRSDGYLEVPVWLILHPELSQAFIDSVRELNYLSDPQGRLQIPLRLGGLPPYHFSVDVKYVASKLVIAKGQDLLSGFLQKKQGGKTQEGSPAGTQTPQAQQPAPGLGGLLSQFLSNNLQQETNQESGQTP